MNNVFVTLMAAVVVVVMMMQLRGAAADLSLTYKYTTFTDETVTLVMDNFPVVSWASVNSTELLTPGYIFSPRIKVGMWPKRIFISFSEGCYIGANNKLVVFPYSFPTVNVNLTDTTDQYSYFPSYVKQISESSINETMVVEAGELFIGFRCCVAVAEKQSASSTDPNPYVVNQINVTCNITLTADKDNLELVPSLWLLLGILAAFAIPAVVVGALGLIVRPKKDQKRSDPLFQRKSNIIKCSAFWLCCAISTGVFVAGFLLQIYPR